MSGQITTMWDENGLSVEPDGIAHPLLDDPEELLRDYSACDLVTIHNNDTNRRVCFVAEPGSLDSFTSNTISSIAWWRDSTAAVAAYSLPDGTIAIAAMLGDQARIAERRLTDTAVGGVREPIWRMGWLPGLGALPRLVGVRGDGTIQIFDLTRMQRERVLHHPGTDVVACSPDPKRARIAVGVPDGEIHLWTVDGNVGQSTIGDAGPGQDVTSLAWSPLPSQPLLAAGMSDGTARLWDPDSGRCLAVLDHPARVTDVALTVDGQGRVLLATGCEDGLARIWVSGVSTQERTSHPASRISEAEFKVTDRTPDGLANLADVTSMAWGNGVFSGRLFTATPAPLDAQIRAWNVETGLEEHGFMLADRSRGRDPEAGQPTVRTIACAQSSHSGLLATVDESGETVSTSVWMLDDIASVVYLERSTDALAMRTHIAWSNGATRPLFAMAQGTTIAGSTGTGISIRDAVTWGPALRRRNVPWHVSALAWSHSPDEPVLAVGGDDGRLLILTPLDSLDRGRELRAGGPVRLLGWSFEGGFPLLAVATDSERVEIWDPLVGTHRRTLSLGSRIVSMAWWPTGAGSLLYTLTSDGLLRLWDPVTGKSVHTLPNTGFLMGHQSAAFQQDDRLRLAVRTRGRGIRIYDITTKNAAVPAPTPPPQPPHASIWAAAQGLVTLGAEGLWTPLGLLADVLALLASSQPQLHDSRLTPLAEHQGVARLRALRWPAPARLGLAALLVAGQHAAERAAPEGTGPTAQLAALVRALATAARRAETGASSVSALAEAADGVNDKTLTLLQILGADAVAADPLLPLRLAGHAPELPELPRHTTALHSEEALRRNDNQPRAAAAGLTPGVAGVSRHGPLHAALPTQLALPDDLRMIRYARGELLHRTHPAHRPTPSRSVTLVLDTTPATFGSCESVLRLAAHLVTSIVWRAGRNPTLVTLTHPDQHRELVRPEDLLAVWTSRTLTPPDFQRALKTAGETGSDIVLILTNTHGVRDRLVVGRTALGPRHHLLTAHTPTSAPPPPPVHPNHRQLLTTTGSDQLVAHLSAILAQEPEAAR